MRKGKAIIFSAPSGSGKTTIVHHLLKNNSNLGFSISACTRDKRGRKEENGKDYYFLSPEEFRKKIESDEFIEWEEVYEGNFYGTLKSEIQRIWDSGKEVIFDVDVEWNKLSDYLDNYRQSSKGLSLKNFLIWNIISLYQALAIFFAGFYFFNNFLSNFVEITCVLVTNNSQLDTSSCN